MPNRWPISSGNWSNAAIWSGSLIPTASDDVWANNFNVFIDQDVTVKTLRNHPVASPVIVAGGSFINTGSRTITCTVPLAGSGSIYGGFVTYSTTSSVLIVTGSDTVNIVSDIMGNLEVPPYLVSYPVSIENNGIVNITGSISGFVYSGVIVRTISGGTLNILGNVRGNFLRGTGGAPSQAMAVNTNKNIIIVGDVTGEAASLGVGITISSPAVVNLDVKGNVFAKSSNAAITNTATSTITITGSVYALSTANALSLTVNPCSVNISGSVFAGVGASAISSTSAGTSSIRGPISASAVFPGVQFSNATHFLSATGPFLNRNNRNAVFAQNLQLISGSTPTWTFDTETALEQRTLYTQNFPGNFPSASNVRSGIVFGDTSQFTGTVAIPPTGSVLKGVLVGNATGSASFDTQNVWGINTNLLTVTGSLGARLRNTATVATDGAAIASKGKL
jgi:hypothetical protein